MSEQERRYVSYLLRLWQIESQGQLVWQASLVESRSGRRRGFASVDALLVYLRQLTLPEADSGEHGDRTRA